MYAVKIEYDSATSSNTNTEIFPFTEKTEAVARFHWATEACEAVTPIPAIGGKTVEIVSVWLYQADALSPAGVIEAVKSGRAVLIDRLVDSDYESEADSN